MYWLNRRFDAMLNILLSILYIAFISLFALDVFSGGFSWPGTVIALFIHLIPTFILIVCLTVAWKRGVVGGSLFLAVGILFTLWFRTYQRLDVFLLISFPLLLIGTLFIISGKRRL
ncbi:hypothetical protein A2346_05065 [candidate division WOR-1 bacterium RIFOXYB12_FULL_52_16]|nr:MAG: hypothetical protein A2346_05065 [candidate division WOR-1 bacterium RIFOXYB12_FULL_52_16]